MAEKANNDPANSRPGVAAEDGVDNTQDLGIVPRGQLLDASDQPKAAVVSGYDSRLMEGRVLLTRAEEKKLMRRVDLHLMPLCALILMVKNLDANNVS